LYGRENGDFKKDGAPEWLQNYCTTKEEMEWQRQKKEEHEKKQQQKKLEYLKNFIKEPPRRDLKARLAEIAAMKKAQLAEGGNNHKTLVKKTAAENAELDINKLNISGVEISEIEGIEGESMTTEKETREENVTGKTEKREF
jgi:hypothetical protein